jgi:multiple antibiotic resistance protein
MIDFVSAFITFFAVIDPVGTVPVFIAVTAGMQKEMLRKVAIKATVTAAFVLVFFVVIGEILLTALEIPLAAFEITGGLVLFIFALTMIFGEGKPEEEKKLTPAKTQVAIFPLAVPSIASPGAMMAAVMQTENASRSLVEQLQVTAVIFAVLCLVLILMLSASLVNRVIGDSGAAVVSRVMGLILASVAVTSVLSGIDTYFGL